MSDASQLKAAYDRDGFVVVRQFMPSDELAELTGELARYIGEVVPTLPDSDAFYVDRGRPETLKQLQHMDCDPYFADYPARERWRRLAEQLVGEPCSAGAPEWFNKPPGTGHRTPPHQDNFYFCLRPCHVVTCWLALDPVGEQNGCLRYVAGSHLAGIRDHDATSVVGFSQGIRDYGPEDAAREAAVTLEPGDLAAHHGALIHRADPNISDSQHRRAFAIVYRGVSVERDEAAYHRYEAVLQRQHEQLGLEGSEIGDGDS